MVLDYRAREDNDDNTVNDVKIRPTFQLQEYLEIFALGDSIDCVSHFHGQILEAAILRYVSLRLAMNRAYHDDGRGFLWAECDGEKYGDPAESQTFGVSLTSGHSPVRLN
jgi:hypothetical protein